MPSDLFNSYRWCHSLIYRGDYKVPVVLPIFISDYFAVWIFFLIFISIKLNKYGTIKTLHRMQ